MDNDDIDSQSHNHHLAGEGNNKFPPVLPPFALPRFDFDDNFHGHLRFDSLVETEVFLGIESSEDNQWIEDFSRGGTGIAFNSSAAESCSISRRNNVWSEATSSESVEMLLKSVGQDENIPVQTISKDSDACDELGCIINQMEPNLKRGDSGRSEVGDDLQPALESSELAGTCSGLKDDVGGDHRPVEDVSQTHEFDTSVHGTLKSPNTRNADLPVTERDESKEHVINENPVETSIDQSVDKREQDDKCPGSQVDTVIPTVQNTYASSALVDSQDATHLKNDLIDENVDGVARENVYLSKEVLSDGENLSENAIASVTSFVEKHSALDMQPKEDGHSIGNITAVREPVDGILKGNSDLNEDLSIESPMQTGVSEDVLSEGKLQDISAMTFLGDTAHKEYGSEVSNTDTRNSTSLESNMDSMVQIACDTIEKKDLVESVCHPDIKILSSKPEKSLVGDDNGYKGDVEGSHNTLGAEPVKECVVTKHNDDYKSDRSVPAAANQNIKSSSDCSNTGCMERGSVSLIKGVDSSSSGTGGTAELPSSLQSDVAISGKSMECVLLPSGKELPAATVTAFDQKKFQVLFEEASSSITKTPGIPSEKGAPCETGGQTCCDKVDRSLSMEDTSIDEGQCGDQTLHGGSLEVVKDICASSIVSDSTVRGTDGAEAQVISNMGSSEVAGSVAIQENNQTSTNSLPSTLKEPSHDAGQNHPEDSDPRLVIKEICGPVAMPHVDSDHAKTHNSYFPSAPSSESQTKILMIESGSSIGDLDNPSCGSPIVIRTSEQSQSKTGKDGVEGSKDQNVSTSGVIDGEENKEQSVSEDRKGNDASPGDRTFTFEKVVEGTPSTSSLSKMDPKAAQEVSHVNLQVSKSESARARSKGTSERSGSKGTTVHRARRVGGKSAGKEATKMRIAEKEMTPASQSKRSDRTGKIPLNSAGIGQLMQSNEMQHCGHVEGGNMKPFGFLSTSVSTLPDLNTSASSSAVFHQPFTDSQQAQLRAQIFVYGALTQGTTPEEAYMISAFGDGGRTIWESVWRACIDRVHSQKSHLASPATPLQTNLGAKTSDQLIKQNAPQNKVTSSPANRFTSKGTPTTVVNPIIPLSSPLWSIPTPSCNAFQPTGIPRSAVMDYRQALSPLHPPPIRNIVVPNASWMSQSPFRVPWVPQTSSFDVNARFPVLPITETVNLTPARESSVPQSSAMKQVSTIPVVQAGSPANVFAGTPLLGTKKETAKCGQHSADPKPRKRKKSTVSEGPGQIILHSQTEPVSATAVISHVSAPAATATPANAVSKFSAEKLITSVSADHLEKGERDSDQRVGLSEEAFGKLQEVQKQAEDASALAAAAVHHSQEIWNQLGKHKNSRSKPDFETELTSASLAIAAAAAVAKAATAAAKVASNAALQAKLMADEALVSSGYKNSILTNAIASDNVKKLGKATPASILRGEDAATSSNSVIIAAREAARRRVEAASAASKRAENMDAIVKAAELTAEAVSQAGMIVAMGEPFPLTELVEAGPDEYLKVPEVSNETKGAIRKHTDKGSSVEGPASSARHTKDVLEDKSLKQSETSKNNNFREGSRVEVLRDGDGLKVAWFLADILDLRDGKAYVCYNELRSKDGDKLKEWVAIEGEGGRAPRIRTARPITAMPFEGMRKRRRAAMGDYNWSVGDRVDSWMQDSWWEGVVSEKSQKDETSFTVCFPAHGETSVVKAWLLRPSLMWKNGSWVEMSSSQDNNGSSHEGDTPQEKRPRINSPVVETEEKLSKCFDLKESWKPEDTRLLDLSDKEKVFNIGKSTRDESKPDSLRTIRTGLKEGSGVIFGVPKPGKKRKFMEVSKHYVAGRSSKTRETSDSAKFTKYLMPHGSGTGTKNKIEPKDKRTVVYRPKVLKSGKPPSVSRTIPKDSLPNTVVSEPGDVAAADVNHTENISGKHNVEFRSFSSSHGATKGPVLFTSMSLSSDAPPKRTSPSNAKSKRTGTLKVAPAPGKPAKIEEKSFNGNSMKKISEVEPRRSIRRIQPTSRLLEGLQSSLLISKTPSVSHDRSHKSQSRSTRGNNQV